MNDLTATLAAASMCLAITVAWKEIVVSFVVNPEEVFRVHSYGEVVVRTTTTGYISSKTVGIAGNLPRRWTVEDPDTGALGEGDSISFVVSHWCPGKKNHTTVVGPIIVGNTGTVHTGPPE